MSTSSVPPPPYPPPPPQHVVELKVARIAAIAGIIGAVIGGSVGGVGAYLAAERQVSGASKQAQDDFVRAQRQIAYGNVVNDGVHLASVIYPIIDHNHAVVPTYIALGGNKDFLAAVDKFGQDVATVRVIGSSDAAGQAQAMNKTYGDVRTASKDLYTQPNLRLSRDNLYDLEKLLRDCLGGRNPTDNSPLNRFTEAARRDLTGR